MSVYEHIYNGSQWLYDDVAFRVVAKTGNVLDRYNLGKIIFQCLEDNGELVAQIDASTGVQETNASVLQRSKQCVVAFRTLGVRQGDVIALMAPNILDIVIAMYAGLALGAPVAPVDQLLGINELKATFLIIQPKVICCQSENSKNVEKALIEAGLEATIIKFDGEAETFSDIVKKQNENEFLSSTFDPSETAAMLIPTSGTTGLPKYAEATHKNFMIMTPTVWAKTVDISPISRAIVVAPIQWLSAVVLFLCTPIIKLTRIQSSRTITQKHAYEIINKYKPEFMVSSPTMMTTLVKPGDRDGCDFTCFKQMLIGGSFVHPNLIEEIKRITPKTYVVCAFGMSELTCTAFEHKFGSPPRSLGKPQSNLLYRLIDTETGKDINEPYKNGELWLKRPGIFKGYYNNPEATRDTFSEDGWLKTGDAIYRDEHWNFYYVERIKLMLKYKSHQISPVELEAVIRKHPGVLDVAVTAIEDTEGNDLPTACVVPRPGYEINAQEIKDLVKDNLTESKQLRGGVLFLNEIPMTTSTKVHRRKLKEIVRNAKLE